MNLKNLFNQNIYVKIVCAVLLVIASLLSMFVISKPATSPETYSSVIKSIDDKKATVMGVTATAATVSTVLAVVPGDGTTPIATQIMELSEYLLLVVCALVLEKSLITVMGYVSFCFLVPMACILLAVYIFIKREMLKTLAYKFFILAAVLVVIIPLSVKVSDLIYEVNSDAVEDLSKGLEVEITVQDDEDKNWLEKMVDTVKSGVNDAAEKAKEILNRFIDVIALFVITCCVIPIIVFIAVLWFIKLLFGLSFSFQNFRKNNMFQMYKNSENNNIDNNYI